MKLVFTIYVFFLLVFSMPLALLVCPWGTKLDMLGFYFYRYNSSMTLGIPTGHVVLLNWESGSLRYKVNP
jgi:hypothetical protein